MTTVNDPLAEAPEHEIIGTDIDGLICRCGARFTHEQWGGVINARGVAELHLQHGNAQSFKGDKPRWADRGRSELRNVAYSAQPVGVWRSRPLQQDPDRFDAHLEQVDLYDPEFDTTSTHHTHVVVEMQTNNAPNSWTRTIEFDGPDRAVDVGARMLLAGLEAKALLAGARGPKVETSSDKSGSWSTASFSPRGPGSFYLDDMAGDWRLAVDETQPLTVGQAREYLVNVARAVLAVEQLDRKAGRA